MPKSKLIRRVCPACAVMEEPPEIIRDSLIERGLLMTGAVTPMPVARGCERCSQTGFAGRVAVVETDHERHLTRRAPLRCAPQ